MSGLVLALAAATLIAEPQTRVDFNFETRWRYAFLDDQFRAGGSDQALSGRTLVEARFSTGAWVLGGELIDSRVYQEDSGSTLTTSMVNTTDILQAYVGWHDVSDGVRTDVQLGRFTLNVGSRRFMARNGFRNTINAFTGANIRREAEAWRLTAFLVSPVRRFPTERRALETNAHAWDEENFDQAFLGLHFKHDLDAARTRYEAFLFALDETDATDLATADRQVLTVGGRYYRAPAAGEWDFDLEAAVQWGERSESRSVSAPERDVFATTGHAEIGYTFAAPWSPRLSAELEYASGDTDVSDGNWGRYDPLYGLRRRDFGQTGIHGPLRRENIVAPGLRLTLRRDALLDLRVLYKAGWLASETDVWTDGRLRDVSGQSGRFVGHHLDTRLRYWLVQDRLQLEVGGAVFERGAFADNAPGAPDAATSVFGYSMLTLKY
ncbi:MAG: alginate export family protein [Pseudomonadota bacterium]|nr:alginate export family protein [Pseudomonadota bacterium]